MALIDAIQRIPIRGVGISTDVEPDPVWGIGRPTAQTTLNSFISNQWWFRGWPRNGPLIAQGLRVPRH